MKRQVRKQSEYTMSGWTIEQDSYLIENNTLQIAELCKVLPYSADEIMVRKQILGLMRRAKQLNRLL